MAYMQYTNLFGVIADFIWVVHGCGWKGLISGIDSTVNRGPNRPARLANKAVDANHVFSLGVRGIALRRVDDGPFKGVFFFGELVPDIMQDIERGLMEG